MYELSVSGVQGVWGVLGVQGVEGGLGGPKSGGYVSRSRGFWGGGVSLPQSKVCMSSLSQGSRGSGGYWGSRWSGGFKGVWGSWESGGYVHGSRFVCLFVCLFVVVVHGSRRFWGVQGVWGGPGSLGGSVQQVS